MSAETAKSQVGSDINMPMVVWQDILDTVPTWVRKIMNEGPELLFHLDSGWGATQPDDDDPDGPIGDIYYFVKRTPKDPANWLLYWYERADDGQSLFIQGCSETAGQGWSSDWVTTLLPSLRRLAVTILDNTPHVLGWSDEVLSPDSFVVPVSPKNRPSIERLVGLAYYNILDRIKTDKRIEPDSRVIDKVNLALIPEQSKPTWSNFNTLLRKFDLEPLLALKQWPVTQHDRDFHKEHKGIGLPTICWFNRFKMLHNCVFMLPKYSQLIYQIITGSLKSGLWIIRSHLKEVSGYCPCVILRNYDLEDPVMTYWS